MGVSSKVLLLLFGLLVLLMVTPVHATISVWESGVILYTCDFFGCNPSSEASVQGNIQVGPETVVNDGSELLAQWIGIDNYVNPHIWVQTGWAIGSLPNGVFTSTPIAYAESNTGTIAGSTYKFTQLMGLTFGTTHTFTVELGDTLAIPAKVFIDGVLEYSVQYQEQYGQVSAFGEDHELATASSPDPTMNGHWTDLQFSSSSYSGVSWRFFGSSDPLDALPNNTESTISLYCGSNAVILRSASEFLLDTSTYSCSTGSRGGVTHPNMPISRATSALIGPQGGEGGAPAGIRTYNIWAYVMILTPPSGLAVFLLWRQARKKRWLNRIKRIPRVYTD